MIRKSELLELTDLHDALTNRALAIVERGARRILEGDKDLDEFVMAMAAKEGGYYDPESYDEYPEDQTLAHNGVLGFHSGLAPEFFEDVHEIDDMVSITGFPMRFKHGMKTVTEWGDTLKDPIKWEKK